MTRPQASDGQPASPKGVHSRLPILGDAPAPPPPPYLPTVDALAHLWDEVASKPLWAPPNFWRYVRLRWRQRLRPLAVDEVQIVAPRWKVNDCGACTDTCCVGPHSTVLLGLRDIATLIDLGRTELITRERPAFSNADVNQRPALRRTLSSSAWSQFPVLKKDAMGACRALTHEGRCGLYPSWPMSCARFPYALHADVAQVFYSPRCDSFWIRPDAETAVRRMATAAVAAYNERLRDQVLLAYAPERLDALGVLGFLHRPDDAIVSPMNDRAGDPADDTGDDSKRGQDPQPGR